MRLASLTLERYGPFERLQLTLDPTPGRVNLLVAPNGFGKSVIRTAIGDLLFGIPERTAMDFRYGVERMRLLAEVAAANGTAGGARSLVRRKGRGNTLAVDGVAVPPDALPGLLGDADAAVFRELFGLDTDLLRRGGQELIRSQGRLGQVLFAAGGGMGRVRELLASLEQRRDDFGLAGRRHKSRPLWSATMAAEQARQDLARDALRPEGWSRLERDAEQAATRLATLLAEQASGTVEIERLRLTAAIRPWLGRLERAREALAEVEAAGTPELDADFEPRWRAALAAGAQSASMAEAAETALAAARQARAGLDFDRAWLAAGTRIEALAEARGRAQGAANDLPRMRSELSARRARCDQLRRDLDLHAAASLPPAPVTRDAQRRLGERPALAAAVEGAEQARTDAADLLARTRRELAELPHDIDAASLADLAALLRAGGDPATRREAARRRLRDAECALASALAAIPDRALSEAALAVTAAPSDPMLDAADKALAGAELTHAQAASAQSDCLAQAAAVTAELAALAQNARLPEPDALAQARAARDRLWRQFCGPRPAALDPAAAVALDRAMRDADTVADALIEHGREVAQAAALRDRATVLAQGRAAAGQRLAEAAAALTAARATLTRLAAIAGSEASDAASLRAFLRARAAVVARAIERDAAAREAADTEAALARAGGQLAAAMAMTATTAFEALLAEADRRVTASHSLIVRRAGLARQAAEQQVALDRQAGAAGRAAARLAAWQGEWSAVSTALGRPVGESPAATAEALPSIEALRTAEAARDDSERQVADMGAAVALLTQRVAEAASLAPELRAMPPVEAALALEQRLQAERLRQALCSSADERIAAAAEALARAQADAAGAAQTLAGFRAALLADSDAAAETQLQRSRAATQARRDLVEAEGELARAGGGVPVEALAARAAATTADADAAGLQAIAARQEQLAAEIELARDARDRAAAARDQAVLSSDPAEAALRREAARATLARIAEEALVLHAAHALLQAALDRQAAGADQPLLARIGAIFRDITGGAYAGVAVEDTKAGQAMVALEAGGQARKPLEQLSEGTSDQLYLALRIAALEDYAAAGEPLPFVADDVLQTFDDPRTVATLRALLRLSAHVQVIALTHHAHVGVLAGTLPAGAMHIVQMAG